MARYIIDNSPRPVNFELSGPEARIVQNCKNLLMTQMGEVPYDRLRGFDPALYHLTLTDMRRVLLPEVTRCLTWEPRAKVISADAELYNGGPDILIRAVIEI